MLERYSEGSHEALWEFVKKRIGIKITTLRNDKDTSVKQGFYGKFLFSTFC